MIKAEEALKALVKIGNMMTMNFLNVAERTHSKEEYLLVEHFVQQHLTPTFDEVVKECEKQGVVLSGNYDLAISMIKRKEEEIIFKISNKGIVLFKSKYNRWINAETNNLINMIIKYLEGQT